ncbi:Asp-tRNA(Asn)/Glu-tRNA(Gln) amidotransferase subunit GatC [Patescibacteria group bacterium]|nr:Asp-tRNA(Asn)/Glu-tRNA(Gln) amidotransferase subunit GatC [Patescibacteria group bacterium]
MISPKEVQKIAQLARIELAPGEEEKLSKDLESILRYMDSIAEVAVEDIEESMHTVQVNVFRSDRKVEKFDDAAPLVAPAPRKEKGFIKVKKIIG